MAFDRWRIGMDMEPDVLRALALSRDRAEWRCRGWWQFPLPMARDAQGDPCPVAVTVDALRRWRCQLPRRLSVRLCLTGLPVPDRRLGENARGWYLESQLRRRLPSLPVHRLDIAAAALRRMERACGRHPALPLVHQCVSGAYLSRCTAGVAVGLCLWHRVGGGLGDCRRVGAGAGRAAMEQVNLWPWRQTHRQRRVRCLLLLALIVTPAAYRSQQRLTLETRLAKTHPSREAFQAGTAAHGALSTASTARTRFQQRLDIGNQRYLRLFRQLPALLPPQLWLTHIEQRNGRISISGCSRRVRDARWWYRCRKHWMTRSREKTRRRRGRGGAQHRRSAQFAAVTQGKRSAR